MKIQGDSSYDYREERAKERYYEEKYSKTDTVPTILAEASKSTQNIDNYEANRE